MKITLTETESILFEEVDDKKAVRFVLQDLDAPFDIEKGIYHCYCLKVLFMIRLCRVLWILTNITRLCRFSYNQFDVKYIVVYLLDRFPFNLLN